ncbi:nuclear transport factor 2 family protein [Nocardioides kongjuensis]|uniref:Ketosteroid isomerase-like protein n=1 Tax=Nocardioides kongjuensis TaxID=349522 RepID=A0A852R7N6_9ACTN|nr:nuclear transport factor 2 family protein [Nocardioides kongjuensis]NYD30903.1 ketosteroid isomerase-like protein [Nocardioides kongjuensis]
MPLSLEDKLAIIELSNAQMRSLDEHDIDAWVDAWVPDGTFVATYGTFAGHAAIRTFIEGHIAAGKEDGARHLMTNHVVAAGHTAGTATLTCAVTKLQVEEPPYIIASGIYRDVVVRTADGWRFTSRELSIDRGVFARAELAAASNGGGQ